MSLNLNEAIQKMRKVGPCNIRTLPMPGQNIHTGQYRIEIREGLSWVCIVEGLPKATADDLIRQSTNRVLYG